MGTKPCVKFQINLVRSGKVPNLIGPKNRDPSKVFDFTNREPDAMEYADQLVVVKCDANLWNVAAVPFYPEFKELEACDFGQAVLHSTIKVRPSSCSRNLVALASREWLSAESRL